jgi:hypothetical protein
MADRPSLDDMFAGTAILDLPPKPKASSSQPVSLQTGGEGDAFPGVQEAPTAGMPYSEQMQKAAEWFGRFGKGFGKGVVGGVAGAPGDIEQLARQGFNLTSKLATATGGFVPPEYQTGSKTPTLVSEKSYLPTSQRVEEALFAKPKTLEEKVGVTAGEILGVPTVAGLGKGLVRKGTEAILGRTTKTIGDLASKAEDLGFKLEPRQLREEQPLGSPGFMGAAKENQRLANELASEATGVKSKEISPQFINDRLKEADKSYSNIFDRQLKIDKPLIDDLNKIAEFEGRVRPADVRSATQASNNIIGTFNRAQSEIGQPITALKVDGKELQRLRNDLSYIARTANIGDDRRVAGQFVEAIDNAIARNNKSLAKELADTNRKYAATKTLQDMIEKGTVSGGNISLEKLGDYIAANSYGFGAGTSRHPLADLGMMGRELNIRGLFQGVQEPSGELSQLLSKTGRFATPFLRTQPARSAQRALSEGTGIYREGVEGLPVSALEAAYETQKQKGQ